MVEDHVWRCIDQGISHTRNVSAFCCLTRKGHFSARATQCSICACRLALVLQFPENKEFLGRDRREYVVVICVEACLDRQLIGVREMYALQWCFVNVFILPEYLTPGLWQSALLINAYDQGDTLSTACALFFQQLIVSNLSCPVTEVLSVKGVNTCPKCFTLCAITWNIIVGLFSTLYVYIIESVLICCSSFNKVTPYMASKVITWLWGTMSRTVTPAISLPTH